MTPDSDIPPRPRPGQLTFTAPRRARPPRHLAGRTIEGRAVRGLCGAYFVPHQDHMVLSACPQCDEVWEKLPR